MILVTVERMYVFDDLSTSWETSEWHDRYPNRKDVVGSCNGILCICDKFGGILLCNLFTRDKQAVPSPRSWCRSDARTFSFTHDPTTGRYMVVHVPRYDRVMVFTLGEAAWREFVIPCYIFLHDNDGFVTIGNMMYWSRWDNKIMSLCLDGERAPSVIPLPSSRLAGTWRLTQVVGMAWHRL